ncbi:RPRD1A [Cordylochernes scorpioides]|uniref:RPRD1A n=1 Tax=Cordylochernes scorpioides TaxID=51811 RepID=A0ABY6L4Q5_9ARAC|nr:RPRD1A [Cordylochernes scorpioides]
MHRRESNLGRPRGRRAFIKMSAGFSESALEKKLDELNNSQHCIQTLSLWLIHHRKHHKIVIQVWLKELKKAPPRKKLTFVYLANDVIQNSRKKGNEYIKEFITVLPKAFSLVNQQADDKTKTALGRILDIWQERNIYDKAQLEKLKQALLGKKKKAAPHTPPPVEAAKLTRELGMERSPIGWTEQCGDAENSGSATPPPAKKRKSEIITFKEEEEKEGKTPPGEPPDAEELIKALLDLENCASTDAVVREKIASLPPEVSDPSMLEKIKDKKEAEQLSNQVEEALSLLSDYNHRLSQEQEDRREVARMLADYTHSQRNLLLHNDIKLEEYREKLKRVNHVRSELKSHLQKLPDLSLLPNVTQGLAPLPSAGDLFRRPTGDLR